LNVQDGPERGFGHTMLAPAATIAAIDIPAESHNNRLEAKSPRTDRTNVKPAASIRRNATT
jgi:hypothetical protein